MDGRGARPEQRRQRQALNCARVGKGYGGTSWLAWPAARWRRASARDRVVPFIVIFIGFAGAVNEGLVRAKVGNRTVSCPGRGRDIWTVPTVAAATSRSQAE